MTNPTEDELFFTTGTYDHKNIEREIARLRASQRRQNRITSNMYHGTGVLLFLMSAVNAIAGNDMEYGISLIGGILFIIAAEVVRGRDHS